MPVYACAREEDNSKGDRQIGGMEVEMVWVGCMNADIYLIPDDVARGGMLPPKFATA